MKRAARGPLLFVLSVLMGFAPGVQAQGSLQGGLRRTSALVSGVQEAAVSFRRPALARYDVVALRVEFQPDSSRFTTGDGTFGDSLYRGVEVNIDPLPHDAGYFEAHLAFLQDYVAQASAGQTTVTTHLLPEVVRVSQPMAAYAPIGPDDQADAELSKLAGLVREAWTLAGQASAFDATGLDPETTCFVLFHAGAGRDIELVGSSVNLDKTPEDLPSLFFDAVALERLAGGDGLWFKGVPVRNTAIVPETESRLGINFITDEPFVLELSINGLLAASFFNFLGVPDLFDTLTGESAIGPYGLMDPLGIFAYNGLFPPLPSAWTKYYLGWMEPGEGRTYTGAGPETLSLSALPDENGWDGARVQISEGEYFLVENRHRDPQGDGLVLWVYQNGEFVEQRFANDDETFSPFDLTGFAGGVVAGVDHYDWAMPGAVVEDVAYDGGVLIWHVDERRLEAGLPENRVNADPERRAVDLEEADGAQDIGFPPNNPFAARPDLGTAFDLWYEGNPATAIVESGREVQLYENRFGPDTRPSSATNAGGASFVVLEGFSARGVSMQVVYRREAEAGILPRPDFNRQLACNDGPLSFARGFGLKGTADTTRVLAFGACPPPIGPDAATPVWLDPATTTVLDATAPVLPAVMEDGTVVLVRESVPEAGEEAGWIVTRVTEEGTVESRSAVTFEGAEAYRPRSPLVVVSEGVSEAGYFWLEHMDAGDTRLARMDLRADRTDPAEPEVFEDPIRAIAQAGDGQLAVVQRTQTTVSGGTERWTYPAVEEDSAGVAFGRDRGGLIGVVWAGGGRLVVLLDGGEVVEVDLGEAPDEAGPVYPVLVDLDGDGLLDILAASGTRLFAVSRVGGLMTGFPIALPARAVGQPLVAELTDSGGWSLLVATADGQVQAFDLGNGGRMVPGFPLAAGQRVAVSPLLQGENLFAVSEDGAMSAWRLQAPGRVWWGEVHHDRRNSGFVVLEEGNGPGAGEGLLIEHEVYNWPNPVREAMTHLRVAAREECRVTISVIDLAGSLVDEILVGTVRAGVPVDHPWEVDLASGVYMARVTAETDSGETDTRLIKIAVIR